jgi:hypothetical protein
MTLLLFLGHFDFFIYLTKVMDRGVSMIFRALGNQYSKGLTMA